MLKLLGLTKKFLLDSLQNTNKQFWIKLHIITILSFMNKVTQRSTQLSINIDLELYESPIFQTYASNLKLEMRGEENL